VIKYTHQNITKKTTTCYVGVGEVLDFTSYCQVTISYLK